MISDLFSLIFPENCIGCNRSLISEENLICTACKLSLPLTSDHLNQENDLSKKFVFEPKVKSVGAFIYFHQGGITQKLIHHLKYKKKKELGELMGKWYAEKLDHLSIDLIIPVPLHIQKERKRGYNQSEYFAKGIGNELEIDVVSHAIKRELPTLSQTRKSKVKRWADLENVYSKASTKDVANKSVLVVDDVITTGATVGMLCDRLVDANVGEIHIAAIARQK